MTDIADRASSRTLLAWGFAEAPVALMKTSTDKADRLPEWETAGPSGRPLERALVKGGKRCEPEAPVEIPVTVAESDPLSAAPAVDPAPRETAEMGVCEVGSDESVTPDEFRRGLRADDGTFIDVTDQLEKIAVETKLEVMEVIAFIRREQIHRDRIVGSYYLASDGPGVPKVLALLRHAMAVTARVAVVKWTKRTRQALGVIIPGTHGSLEVIELEWSLNMLRPGPRCLAHVEVGLSQGEKNAATELARAMAESSAVLDDQEDDRVRLEHALELRARTDRLEGFALPEKPAAPESDDLAVLLEASLSLAGVPSA